MTPASCTLHVLLARNSARAVVIRRGPSRQACLVAWDRTKDRFQAGQWFKGRIHEDRCDLSADGALMVAFLANHRPPFGTWTVLCRPPYLTAAALWPNGSTWGGGGRFLKDGSLYLFQDPDGLAAGFALPDGLRVSDSVEALDEALRPHPGELRPGMEQVSAGGFSLRRDAEGYAVECRGGTAPLQGASWAGLDANGDLLFALGGALLRLRADRMPRDPRDGAIRASAKVLADLSGMTFAPLQAPYGPRRGAGPPVDGRRGGAR